MKGLFAAVKTYLCILVCVYTRLAAGLAARASLTDRRWQTHSPCICSLSHICFAVIFIVLSTLGMHICTCYDNSVLKLDYNRDTNAVLGRMFLVMVKPYMQHCSMLSSRMSRTYIIKELTKLSRKSQGTIIPIRSAVVYNKA